MKIKSIEHSSISAPCEVCGKPNGQNIRIKYLVISSKKKYERNTQPFFGSSAINNLSLNEVYNLQKDMTPGEQTKNICTDCFNERCQK